MDPKTKNKFLNVCPRRCYSSCTMISHVENDRLIHISADPSHPYTKGKLCAKGYSYIERNYHHDRLKFPYYQKVKGSGKFKQITWEKAYDLIISEMMSIYQHFDHFNPLAFYKGSGNIGVHHFVTDQFFLSIDGTTRIAGSAHSKTGFDANHFNTGVVRMPDPSMIRKSSMIIIWGANPAATNIHLIPYLIHAKIKGAKLVVIDPLYTQTAELADLYIQIRPSTDGALANLLIKNLIEEDVLDHKFIQEHFTGFNEVLEQLKEIDKELFLNKCAISEEAFDLLFDWLKEAETVSHILGFGLQRHANGGQNIRAIEALAAVHGDIGKPVGGIYIGNKENQLFNNQQLYDSGQVDSHHPVLNINEICENDLFKSTHYPIEMLWISCGNPLNQEPNSHWLKKYIENIPFVVTVDQFLTPTAQMSNLVLPTTTHFEEFDIITNGWHGALALNEKAINPFFQSRSEWNIMNELAKRINEIHPDLCTFPNHSSEEDYLNAQFNEKVRSLYRVDSISDLKGKIATASESTTTWSDRDFAKEMGKFQFLSSKAQQHGHPALPLFSEGKLPSKDYPYWLLTPHNPYMFNSQFQFLDLTEEGEAYVEIHPSVAKELDIYNGKVVKIYNDQACIEIKAVYSAQVPRDILLIYQGWYPDSEVNVNQLVPFAKTDVGGNSPGLVGTAVYDTFVNVGKL